VNDQWIIWIALAIVVIMLIGAIIILYHRGDL